MFVLIFRLDCLAVKDNLFLACKPFLDAVDDLVQVARFVDKIQIIGTDGQYRAEVKNANPFLVIRIQQLKVGRVDCILN